MSSIYAEFKRVENSRVARERDGRRGKELVALLAAVVPVAAALLAYTGLHLQTVQVGYEIDRGRHTVAKLQEERQKLLLRMAADTSPERAAEFAKKANLGAPKPGQVYFVSRAGKP
ncbi:MAG: hypothetical protein ACRD16_02735 [Thermoanaerobaculia bacterium]